MTVNSKSVLPDLTDDIVLAKLVQELTDRFRRGEPVVLEAIVQQYPQYAGQLEDLLPTVQALAVLDLTADRGDRQQHVGDDPAFGGTIGEYQIVREIGRGGMGIVYEARQLSLNRRVALKVLPFAAALDSRALARFQQESLAAAQLDHPHIVPVYGVGADRGVHYYAMRFVEGHSLAQVIAGMLGAAEPFSRDVEKYAKPFSREAQPSALAALSVVSCQLSVPKFENPNPKSGPTDIALGCTSRLNTGVETTAVKRAPLSTDRDSNRPEYFRSVARLGIQAAEALDYAHEHSILHRDIKPGNLLIDDKGDVSITDFGLARTESAGNLTATGDLIGTLRYMSPEQVSANRGLVDRRTDVYSLGATLYELLALRAVFPGEDRAELLQQIGHDDPRPLKRIDAAIPEELQTIVLKCLEKDPADRYGTAHDLADDLHRFLDHRPIAAREPGIAERVRKWSRRHQTVVLASVVTLFVSTAFLAGSTLWVVHERDAAREAERQSAVQAELARTAEAQAQESLKRAEQSRRQEERQRKLAETAQREWRNAASLARTEQQTAQQTVEFVVNLFRSGDAVGLQGTGYRARSETVREMGIADLLSRAAERVRRELHDQPQTQATLLDTLGDIYRSLGMFSEAEPLLIDALELRKKDLPEGDSRIGESLHHLGWLKHDEGDYQGGEALYRSGLELFEKWPPAELRLKLRLQMSFAWLLSDYRKDVEAERIFRDVLAACAGKDKEYAVEITAAQAGAVSTLYAQGREDQAQLLTLQQLAAHNQLLFANAVLMVQRREAHRKSRDYDAALKIQQELLKIVRGELGVDHPSYALLLGEAAGFYRAMGDFRTAEKYIRESIAAGRHSLGEHPKVFEPLLQFATDLARRGDFNEAEEYCLRDRRQTLPAIRSTVFRLLRHDSSATCRIAL